MQPEPTTPIAFTCPTCSASFTQEMDAGQIEIMNRLTSGKVLCDSCSDVQNRRDHAATRIRKAKLRYDFVIEELGIIPPEKMLLRSKHIPIANWRPTDSPGMRSVYLWGPPRSSKTTLAAMISKRMIWEMNTDASVITGTDLQWLTNPGDLNQDAANAVQSSWMHCRILIFDDIDKRAFTPAAIEYLYRVLNWRLERGKTTIITSNSSPKQLEQLMAKSPRDAEAIVARIIQHCSIFEVSPAQSDNA